MEDENGIMPDQNGKNVDTVATDNDTVDDVSKQDNLNAPENTELVKEFTKDDVKRIMQKRINRSHKSFYDRYGVKDLDELDAKFALIEQLTNEKGELASKNQELLDRLAFIENDINPERFDDIKAYFKGKDIMFNEENLKIELATHPEWKNIIRVENAPTTTIKEMSPQRSLKKEEDEQESVAKLFGLDKIYRF